MSDLIRLSQQYPWIRWEVPVPVSVPGHGTQHVCRICIARVGLRWELSEGSIQAMSLSGEPLPFGDFDHIRRHIAQKHV